ncbi:MAG: porin [Porticoccaceae bacterium]
MNKSLLTIALGSMLVFGPQAYADSLPLPASPTMADVVRLLQQQQAEIEALKAELRKTDNKVEATATAVEETASKVQNVAGPDSTYAKVADVAQRTHVGGYGEIHYNNKKNGGTDEIDLHRFVMFLGHKFTDDVLFFSEIEIEHSIAGEGKKGEAELEQAYIDWDYADNHGAKLGLFLIPVGILNETHEPDTFYGVERNNVERNIIPATWWESGVMLDGQIAPGFSYDIGVHSGFKNDATGSKAFDIRGGRQKSSEAVAEALAYTGRLKYTGVPGLELAVAVSYQEDLLQGLGADKAPATLYETHAVYQTGPFGLRALYARWDIDNDQAEAIGRDEQTGWYVEPSYRLTPRFGVFARYSQWDTAAGGSADTEVDQFDIGVNFWLVEHVVLKADLIDQSNGTGDSFNLGIGWSF